MGFLNVYNNFKDFNAHLSHAFKVTFFDNILTNDENAASFSVKSVTKPVFKLSTEEYTRELGNSRFVIPIIDFSSAHMSITFYESDNMAVQAYLSSIYGSIGTVPSPIKILLEEYDNSMCIRLSSKVYLARLIELSLPGFNNDGPGSIQEITAEFNVMRVYDNLPDLTAPVDLTYGYKGDYKFKYNDKEINVETSTLKPSAIKIDNLTFTQDKWKKLQITKKNLVSEYKTKMSELKKFLQMQLDCSDFIPDVDAKIAALRSHDPLRAAHAEAMLSNIIVNEDKSVYTKNGLDQWTRRYNDLEELYAYIIGNAWTNEGLGLNITREEFAAYVDLSFAERNIKPLKTELKGIANRLIGMQGTIEELKNDQEVIEFVAEHPEYKDEELSLESIPGEPAGGGQGSAAPAPGGGRQGGNGQGGSAPAPAAPAPAPAGDGNWKTGSYNHTYGNRTISGNLKYKDISGSITRSTVRKFYATTASVSANASGMGSGNIPNTSNELIKHIEIHRTAALRTFGTTGWDMGETIIKGPGVGGFISRDGTISYNLDRAFTKHSGAGGLGSNNGATFAIEMAGAVNVVRDENGKYYQRICGLGGDVIYKEMTEQEKNAYTLIEHTSANSSANMLENARKNTGNKKVKMLNGDIKTVNIVSVYAQGYNTAEINAMKEYGYQFAKDGVKVDLANLKISAHGDSSRGRGKTEGINSELAKLLAAFKEGYRLGQGS